MEVGCLKKIPVNHQLEHYMISSVPLLPQIDQQVYDKKLTKAGITVLKEEMSTGSRNKKLQNFCTKTVRVRPVAVQAGGAFVTYHVEVGRLAVPVKMLNLNSKAPKEHHTAIYFTERYSNEILVKHSLKGEPYIVKRHYFSERERLLRREVEGFDWVVNYSYSEFQCFLVECAFAKICSALGVGVTVGSPDFLFDIVRYENGVEFYMEKCKVIFEDQDQKRDMWALEQRLRYCMHLIHAYGIVHKDIKPANILIDRKKQAFLADFGISMFVWEKPGQKTLTYREGTVGYMSPDMQDHLGGKRGLVDLYYNDLWALEATMDELRANQTAVVSPSRKRVRLDDIQHHPCEGDLEISRLSTIILGDKDGGATKMSIVHEEFSFCFGKSQSKPEEVSADFLVRSMGPTYTLIPFLKELSNPNIKTQLLLSRLCEGTTADVQFCLPNDEQPGDQQMLRRSCYQALRTLDSREKSKPEVCSMVCELAWQLIRQLHFLGLWEEPYQILNRIEKYALDSHRNEFQALRMANSLIQGRFEAIDVFEYLKGDIGREAYFDLLPGVISCFRVNEVALCVLIIGGCFPKITYDGIGYSREEGYDFVGKVFKHAATHQESNTAKVMLKILEAEFRQGYHAKFGCLTVKQIEKLPWEIRKTCLSRRAQASIFQDDLRTALECYSKAYQLSCEHQSEWAIERLTINLERCAVLQIISHSQQALQTAQKTLKYVIQVGSMKQCMLVGYSHYLLAQGALRERKVEQCLDHTLKTLQMIKEVYYSSFSSALLLFLYVGLLKVVFDIQGHTEALLTIGRGTVQFLDKFYSEPFNKRVLMNYPIQALLRRMFQLRGIDEPLPTHHATIDNISQLLSHHHHCVLYLSNRSQLKVLQEAVAMNQLLEQHEQSLDGQELLFHIVVFVQMRRAGMVKEASKWAKLAVERALMNPQRVNTYRIAVALGSLWSMGLEFEAYTLAQRLFFQRTICSYIAASWFYRIKDYAESERYYTWYIDHETLDNADPYYQECLASSHENLIRIYILLGQPERAQYHRRQAYLCYRHLEPLEVYEQLFTILKFYEEGGFLHQFHLWKIRMYKLATGIHTLLQSRRIEILVKVGVAAYRNRQYSFVERCLRCIRPVNNIPFDGLLILAQCFVVKGNKRRQFYNVAGLILLQQLARQQILREFLSKRKEFVKIFVLWGEHPVGYLSLSNISQWLKNGLPIQYNAQSSLSQKMRDLRLLKRVSRQQRYLKAAKTKTNITHQLITSILGFVSKK